MTKLSFDFGNKAYINTYHACRYTEIVRCMVEHNNVNEILPAKMYFVNLKFKTHWKDWNTEYFVKFIKLSDLGHNVHIKLKFYICHTVVSKR